MSYYTLEADNLSKLHITLASLERTRDHLRNELDTKDSMRLDREMFQRLQLHRAYINTVEEIDKLRWHIAEMERQR